MRKRTPDRVFLGIVIFLVILGLAIFMSASLGLLAQKGIDMGSIALKQLIIGVVGGGFALVLFSNIHYRALKKYSFYFFLITFIITLLVFIPSIGIEHGGARRWISLGAFSFQPAEFLKLGFVVYFAAVLSSTRNRIASIKYGVLPVIVIVGIIGVVLLAQPDTGTFLVILITAFAMFLAAGGKWKHIALGGVTATVGLGILATLRPYIKERLLTFIDPARDSLGAGYQIQQSLIAIGSGEISGRGLGQSVQKFNYLPEPIGDSIFAVAAEEFGFIGAAIIIAAFLAFAVRGISIAQKAPDYFSGLLVLGIVILIISQSFINIASMLGVFPLTGLPLLFISKGGTALFTALASVGIILNVSKYRRT
ncbi:MAG TPA: cell division protein FtsW [Ignavibacteria bacterium]|nr:cell division protein FtsW [Ignavibacteria bacterium]